MEEARAEEAFLPGKEGRKKSANGKPATDLGQVTTALMGTAGAITATTIRDEQEDGPQRQGEAHLATRRCLQDIGEESENK